MTLSPVIQRRLEMRGITYSKRARFHQTCALAANYVRTLRHTRGTRYRAGLHAAPVGHGPVCGVGSARPGSPIRSHLQQWNSSPDRDPAPPAQRGTDALRLRAGRRLARRNGPGIRDGRGMAGVSAWWPPHGCCRPRQRYALLYSVSDLPTPLRSPSGGAWSAVGRQQGQSA